MNKTSLLRNPRKGCGIRIVRRGRGYIEAIRAADGFRIFLDGDPALDMVRITAKDPRVVILAVSFRRAQQIATGYAKKYAPQLLDDIKKAVGYETPCYQPLPTVDILNDPATVSKGITQDNEANRKG